MGQWPNPPCQWRYGLMHLFLINPKPNKMIAPLFPQRHDLVPAWIRLHYSKRGTLQHEEDFWALEMIGCLVWEQPELAWSIILDILAADSSPRILGYLAAGPLEDLLTKHGERFVDKVEKEARRNPMFRELLVEVGKNGMPKNIWHRIQSVLDRRRLNGALNAPNKMVLSGYKDSTGGRTTRRFAQ
jgi:hypothetical protein